jgi:hypothetical protein
VEYPQKLIFRGGLVKVGSFFVHKKCVRRPNEVNIFSTHDELLQPLPPLKLEPRVSPELAKVHVKREILKKMSKFIQANLDFFFALSRMRKRELNFFGQKHQELR